MKRISYFPLRYLLSLSDKGKLDKFESELLEILSDLADSLLSRSDSIEHVKKVTIEVAKKK